VVEKWEEKNQKGKMRYNRELEGRIETGVEMDRSGKVNQREICGLLKRYF